MQPVLNVHCHHVLCLNCLLSRVEGNQLDGLECPINECENLINPSSFIHSKCSIDLIQRIKIKCSESCGVSFKITDMATKIDHEKNCFGKKSSSKLAELFDIDVGKAIPREIEDAAAHIVKTRLAQSKTKEISFNTGGSRVIIKLLVILNNNINLLFP